MAHVRHDNLTAPIEWWKHLRPDGKRTQNRMERSAAKQLINSMLADLEEDRAEYTDYLLGGGYCDCGDCQICGETTHQLHARRSRRG